MKGGELEDQKKGLDKDILGRRVKRRAVFDRSHTCIVRMLCLENLI